MKKLLFLLLLPFLLHAQTVPTVATQPNGFIYTLAKDYKVTSGSIYLNGVMVRTAWSNKADIAGSHTYFWDGKDDNGNTCAAGNYTLQIFSDNNTYVWEGTIGNNSDSTSGFHIWRGGGTPTDICQSGTDVYACLPFSEVSPAFVYFHAASPRTMNTRQSYLTTYAGNLAICTDGTLRYIACRDYQGAHSFVIAEQVSNNAQYTFSSGVSFTGTAPNTNYTSVINLNASGIPGFITSMAVQGTGSYLFISHRGTGTIDVLNKTTGAFVRTDALAGCTNICKETDSFLWVATGTAVTKYTINSDGTLTTTGISISGLQNIVGLDILSGNMLVADAGTNEVVFEYNTTTLALTRTIGTTGGYATSPTITNTKFDFQDLRGTYLCFVRFYSDGTFWIGDTGDCRMLHFDASGSYIESVNYLPEYTFYNNGTLNSITYNVNICQNQPTSVFWDFLEFTGDYSQPFSSRWTLTNNWGATLPTGYHNTGTIHSIATLSNGHRYMIIANNTNSVFKQVELTSTGLRFLTTTIPVFSFMDVSGNLLLGAETGSGSSLSILLKHQLHTGYSGNDPTYTGTTTYNTINVGYQGPSLTGPWGTTTSGKSILFDISTTGVRGGAGVVFHLGGYNSSGATLWQTAKSTFTNYSGTMPLTATYDVGNGVRVPAGTVGVTGNDIVTIYHGEFWKASQTGFFYHYTDKGLLQGVAGLVGTQISPFQNGTQAMAGYPGYFTNAQQVNVCTVSGNIYAYFNDEAVHCGISAWKITPIDTVTQSVTIPLIFRPFVTTPTRHDLLQGVPENSNVVGITGWSQNPASNSTSGSLQFYTRTRKAIYDLSLSPDVIVNSTGIGAITYWLKRDLQLPANVNHWSVSGQLDLSVNTFSSRPSFEQFYIAVLDVNGKIIAKMQPFLDKSFQFNGTSLGTFTNVAYQPSDFVLQRSGSQVYLQITIFGQKIWSYQNIFDGTADITNPKYFEIVFQYTTIHSSNAQFGINKLFSE